MVKKHTTIRGDSRRRVSSRTPHCFYLLHDNLSLQIAKGDRHHFYNRGLDYHFARNEKLRGASPRQARPGRLDSMPADHGRKNDVNRSPTRDIEMIIQNSFSDQNAVRYFGDLVRKAAGVHIKEVRIVQAQVNVDLVAPNASDCGTLELDLGLLERCACQNGARCMDHLVLI